MSLAREFTAFCLREKKLPREVAERAWLCVADHLHAVLSGAGSATLDILKRYLSQGTGREAETLALLCGAASAVLEIDDVHWDTSLHTGSVVVAAAFGAALDADADDVQLLRAVTFGYELAVRLSLAAGERHYRYFHSTATCGTVAAALTAAVMYGLDEDQTVRAVGLAATMAAGLWEDLSVDAIGVKHLHSGLAAERGVRAAKLAFWGAGGAERSLEGGQGFLAALARPDASFPQEIPPDEEALRGFLLEGLGRRWAIERNIFKRYAFCLGCFEPLESLRGLLADSGKPADEAASVLVEMYPPVASLVNNQNPRDQLRAKFSAAFAVALVLAGKDPENVFLPAQWLDDPAVTRWYPLITCVPDPALKRRTARVTVTWKDGTRGVGEHPLRDLSPGEVMARFSRAARQYAPGAALRFEERLSLFGTPSGEAREIAELALEAMGLQPG